MARSPKVKPDLNDDDKEEAGQIVAAIEKLTATLQSIQAKLDILGRTSPQRDEVQPPPLQANVNIWEDDPFSETAATTTPPVAPTVAVQINSIDNPSMQIDLPAPRPAPGLYVPGTPEFRYWLAIEALTRGISFWQAILPSGTTWSAANPLPVTLFDPTETLNAQYQRQTGLQFYGMSVRDVAIHAAESPDVVCHELGHAVLDAVKPELFDAASTETAAFHEAFGDMNSILCALQLSTLRERVVRETGGRLSVNSRLSRLAEQLGWGIRCLSPEAAEADCLRNAANRFAYDRPDRMPATGPAGTLSTEPHSFSRVFTGAFLDVVAWSFDGSTAGGGNLAALSRDMGQLLIDAVSTAAVTPDYFSQVAAAMMQADRVRFGAKYQAALRQAFVERGILHISSIAAIANAPPPVLRPVAAPPGGARMASAGRAAAKWGATMALTHGEGPVDGPFRLPLGHPQL